MQWLVNFIRDKIIAHFWGIVEGAMYGAIVGLIFNALEKSGIMADFWKQLHVAYNAYDTAGDVLGTAGLIIGIPSAIFYIIGRFLGKYKRFLF